MVVGTFKNVTLGFFASLAASFLEQVAPAPAAPVANSIMSYSESGDVTAYVSTVSDILGCNATGLAGFPAGDIALISRGACTFAFKVTNAYYVGASGVVIYNHIAGQRVASKDPNLRGL